MDDLDPELRRMIEEKFSTAWPPDDVVIFAVESEPTDSYTTTQQERPTDPPTSGYNSRGTAALTFKPSNVTRQTYKIKPGTPYDLILPYRTPELAFYVDQKLVKLVRVGDKELVEQIMFTEDSLRGAFSVRALDDGPKEGTVFVARWDFVREA